MACAFLGKYSSITAVDLIQRRNWILGIFMNLILRKPESILYRSIRIMTVYHIETCIRIFQIANNVNREIFVAKNFS